MYGLWSDYIKKTDTGNRFYVSSVFKALTLKSVTDRKCEAIVNQGNDVSRHLNCPPEISIPIKKCILYLASTKLCTFVLYPI
jgi:hypothetical protein